MTVLTLISTWRQVGYFQVFLWKFPNVQKHLQTA